MTTNAIFHLITAVIVFSFLMERCLEYLNSSNRSANLPDELKGIYDEEKYAKSVAYDKVNSRFGFITSTFNFALTMTMLLVMGFAFVDSLAGGFTCDPIFKALVFFAIIGIASDLLNLPFGIYDTFVIEQRFGFNKTTPATFALDKVKGWVLSAFIGGVLGWLILWFYYKTTSMFWIYAWSITAAVMIFFAMFYSNLIVPLFNKQTPLEDGELKEAIQAFAAKTGFKLDNIYKIDGSKRSTKANAYFTGLGSKKRIVLYDTLINELSTAEIVAVLAHEIGHYKHRHTLQGIVISLVQTALMFFLVQVFISRPELSAALGVAQPSFHIGIIAFGILYSPLSMLMGIAMNVLSRKNEYQADNFAREHHSADDLINALKKLSVNNLSNLTPHPLYVFFHYSHPSLLQRIKNLKK